LVGEGEEGFPARKVRVALLFPSLPRLPLLLTWVETPFIIIIIIISCCCCCC